MGLRMRSPLPSLEGAAAWVNGKLDPLTLQDKPVLVHFWSLSCYMCHDVANQVAGWRERYTPQGLAIVSIHQPRSPEELDVVKISEDARGPMNITQPCAIDNEHAIVDRFENAFVPAYYLFNRDHQLRHFQAGDKGYDRIEAAVKRVLDESRS
jgi:thiol-disulfide isomerase/thioredoxin